MIMCKQIIEDHSSLYIRTSIYTRQFESAASSLVSRTPGDAVGVGVSAALEFAELYK